MQAGCLSHVCFEPTAASALVAGLEAAAESTFPLRRHGIDARRCYATTAYTGTEGAFPPPPLPTHAHTHIHTLPQTHAHSLCWSAISRACDGRNAKDAAGADVVVTVDEVADGSVSSSAQGKRCGARELLKELVTLNLSLVRRCRSSGDKRYKNSTEALRVLPAELCLAARLPLISSDSASSASSFRLPSPSADVAWVSPVPVQMWHG